MENIIIILIVAAIVSSISVYIYRSKKKGAHCIGCPDAKHCDKCRHDR
ncbi:MAG: FeoB-associated Cys-rich membrane protein [Clostridium sp.]|nr:FeoB-associated Cys-rich membrane protein [Clostridium sp.]MCM1546942.1 FeoB-associated Cys-rich membrane protein [Ruminococcus sp.]